MGLCPSSEQLDLNALFLSKSSSKRPKVKPSGTYCSDAGTNVSDSCFRYGFSVLY